MKKYIIIGNGVAGTTAGENIRNIDKEGNIKIISDEGLPFYSRIRLNEYIAGELKEEDLVIRKDSWYEDKNIELILNTRIVDANPEEKTIVTENGQVLSFDKLLIATGSHSFIPPIKGSDKTGVFALRNIDDGANILKYAKDIDDVVVIGGGLLGLEVANALRKTGKKINVVEFFSRLLPRQLDEGGANRLQGIMEKLGLSFRLDAKTSEIAGNERVEEVLLESGEKLPAQMVIISAGVRPNLELAEMLGLNCGRGIAVNEKLETNVPDIFAAGDVAECNEMMYGIWPASTEQGKAAGINMADGEFIYNGTAMANTLKVVGVDVASVGKIDDDENFEAKIVSDEKVYKKIVFDNNKIIGCIMLGDKKGFNKITKAVAEKIDLAGLKQAILSPDFDYNKIL
ncbi:MAG: NAD(P)/FAD-dependent oxidoreductase [Desulfobacterales bacterium]|jgi:nitrite reductase (NADH) large subunit|nr:NAD(P)/FAD-dependent oxidoreductase [Desulfobacteraceae bacterium]MBT4365198.1 NAD(P)/FAD-dependent oxidoreductase [Desulfobacteraceae bacterium]MBT7085504.1 NAD(P)/FAD-dependent oxidoreductase [Desulfobacterales bacterium]MBT7696003.1 NAD(P)/FAD-dependent oxidoreductase [Desulfobacterales bacterium]